MQAAAALAATLAVAAPAPEAPPSGLIITRPQTEVVRQAPPASAPVETLQRSSARLVYSGAGTGPGSGCSDTLHNSLAVMDAYGVVYLYMSNAEQLRRFGRLQTAYAPGDVGYTLASAYAKQGVICGGTRTVEVNEYGG